MKIGKKNQNIEWHGLDNTAKLFPVISSKDTTNVFRVSCILKEDIQKEILQNALDITLPWFKTFNVKLKAGFFWYYFETNKRKPIVEEEHTLPCAYIDKYKNNNFLFRVTYFAKRINLEVFHSITDGTGAICFLKALTYNYIKLAHKGDFNDSNSDLTDDIECSLNIEDSYIKNYKKMPRQSYSSKKSYKLKSKLLKYNELSIIHAYINLEDLKRVCKEKDVTITQYLTAVLMWSIYLEWLNKSSTSLPVSIYIPVNLRKMFKSDTIMNFFSFIAIGKCFDKEDYSFDELLIDVKKQFISQLDKEKMLANIAYNVSNEKILPLRLTPLFLKRAVMKIVYLRSSKAYTTTISNLGKITVKEEFKPYIDSFSFLLNPYKGEPIKCTICSYENDMVLTFTSILDNTYTERAFFRHLTSDGIRIKVESNGVYNEDL